ncbi:group XIIB secretory phospholipase A2 isoform X1 [Sigmodon hispidus]
MKLPCGFLLLWLGLVGSLAQSDPNPKGEESYSDWGLRHLRGSFESVNSYVDSFMELLGGKNGVCQYRCRYGRGSQACLTQQPQGITAAQQGSQGPDPELDTTEVELGTAMDTHAYLARVAKPACTGARPEGSFPFTLLEESGAPGSSHSR